MPIALRNDRWQCRHSMFATRQNARSRWPHCFAWIAVAVTFALMVGPVLGFAGVAHACGWDFAAGGHHAAHDAGTPQVSLISQPDQGETAPEGDHDGGKMHDHALCGVSQPSPGIVASVDRHYIAPRAATFDRFDEVEPHTLSLPAPTEPPRA
jgi:hypothetical protein